MDAVKAVATLYATGKMTTLEFLEFTYKRSLITLLDKIEDPKSNAGAFSSCITKIQEAIKKEREESGLAIDKNIAVEFTDAPDILSDEEPPAGSDNEEFIEGLGEEDLEGHE